MKKIINYIKKNLGYLLVTLGICIVCFFSFIPDEPRPSVSVSPRYYLPGGSSSPEYKKYQRQEELALYKTIGVFCTVIGSLILIKKFRKIV